MESIIQIFVSGLTLGAMYAVGTVSLSLLWGAVNVLNMAHGALLVIGGYASWYTATRLGIPPFLGYFSAALVSATMAVLMYLLILRWLKGRRGADVLIIVATFAIAMILENVVLNVFGGYAVAQPAKLSGGVYISSVFVPAQNILIMVLALVLMALLALILQRTALGRSIRAVAQNSQAAVLMGIKVQHTYIAVYAIAGAFAGFSGVLWSSISTLSPTMGFDPMLKAFVICVAAGLGQIGGALAVAILLGLAEAAIQYYVGVRFALPFLLLAVVALLIVRPQGLFGIHGKARQ
ncbi:branched-chain amino acid ABC transporter permease [Pacificibacter marinus]|uniref:branched-chain amino acid ABC transporter permease n=1 Tax=Pacificibacter marinus TaxID=658057 RepID=UPI001C072D5A|nr:branched-chain amino acid ABC transporter permease [Pacificibacter marinus]MBU2867427.1 branched-chain amino acid ABC transporter permease [Pacificibacter marinus]